MRSFMAWLVSSDTRQTSMYEEMMDIDEPSNISHQPATNDQHGFLAEDAKVVHGVDDAQQRVHCLGLFPNHGLVDSKLDLVVVKVLLDTVSVESKDVVVHDGETTLPLAVALGQLGVLDVEDAVEELEPVLDLFVAAYREAVGDWLHGGFHVRHFGNEAM